jgi:hypothetical protein
MRGYDINMTEKMMIDVLAHATVRHRQMTPLEIGRILHPTAIAVELKHVPAAIIADHRSRYSKGRAKKGSVLQDRRAVHLHHGSRGL